MNRPSSAVYSGWVSHSRLSPVRHGLRYRIFQILLDIDERPALDRTLRLFSLNRFNVFSHFDKDHGDGRPGGLRAWVERTLVEAGLPIDGGRIGLLTMPRLFGHVFNPLSLFYCHRPDGSLAAVIYEVNNTFVQRHWYVMAAETGADGEVRQTCAKAMHVSPFLGMDLRYVFQLKPPAERVMTRVEVVSPDGRPVLIASFAGERSALSDVGLAGLLFGYPFMTLKVVLGIALEALKLRLKGVRLRAAPPAPRGEVTVG